MADMPKSTAQDEAIAKADLTAAPRPGPMMPVILEIDKLIDAEAQNYRDQTLVHSQSAAVTRAAAALAEASPKDAEQLADRFHQLTGFPRHALKAEIDRVKAAKQAEWP
jgi:hypothetical protein